MAQAARLIAALLFVCALTIACAQEQKTPVPLTPSARLNAAMTVFMKDGGGSSIPFDVISSALEAWGRFTMVDSPDKADVVVEVSAPASGSGVSVSSSTRPSGTNAGRPEQNTTTTRELSSGQVKMSVYDPKSKMPLWSASEQPKFAMKQKAREDNLVNAAQRLISKFRERLESATTSK